jgi:formate hydrogenlyase subunit 3/multisubunit Na+/H+ antiporter MnhD subunit
MQHYLIAIVLIFCSGILAFLTGRRKWLASVAGSGGCIIGAAVFATDAVSVLSGNLVADSLLVFPLGIATLRLDALSAFFSLPVLLVCSVAAFYAAAVSRHEKQDLGGFWFFFNLLFAAMLLLIVSANAFTFLSAWEVMSVAAFFLITHRDEIFTARSAGWKFLVASHIGTAGLFILFAVLANNAGSLEFADFSNAALPAGTGTIIFFLGLFGFGVKGGLLPLHVWLPDSYTYSDAHVSAVLSGAMSKMGFYGLIRVIMFLPATEETWGWTLAVGGLITGIFALITGMAQLDLKKVIAYSSMENAGIILVALGAGVLAMTWKQPVIVFAAFAGALLHVLNHAVCKGLLFLGSGSIYWGIGTRKLEAMGGLAGKMPFTALTFGIASAAIAGLPPFNSFISEFVIFTAGLEAATIKSSSALVLSAIIMVGLALIGGLAAACFARTFGLVFLGASRSEKKHEPEEVHGLVKIPMLVLLVAIVCLAFGSPWLINTVARVAGCVCAPAGFDFSAGNEAAALAEPLKVIAAISLALVLLVIGGWLVRRRFFSAGDENERCTWDCGFAAPDARIQYTSSSFSQPLVETFSAVIRPYRHGEKVSGLFPQHASFRTDSPDSLLRYWFTPLFGLVDRILLPLRALQHGRLHLYICYVAITLLFLLIWKVVSI